MVAGSFTAAVLLPGPTVRILFAMFGAALALAGLIWPGGPWAFPAVPWSLHARLDLCVIGLPPGSTVQSRSVRGPHDAPDEPHTSIQPY